MCSANGRGTHARVTDSGYEFVMFSLDTCSTDIGPTLAVLERFADVVSAKTTLSTKRLGMREMVFRESF